jgi:hypothetical protein
MKSRLVALAALVGLLFCALGPPALAGATADEWRQIKKEALKKLMGCTDQARIDAIMQIGGADCRSAVDLLVTLLKKRSPEEHSLMMGAKELEDKIESIYARNKALLKKNMISQVDQIEISKLTMKLNDITKKLNFLTRVKRKTSDALAKCVSQVEYMTTRIEKEKDWQVRLEVIQAMAKIGTDEAKEVVLEGVEDDDSKVRAQALEIILKKDYEKTDDIFIAALQDDYWQVRSVAIQAIRQKKLFRAAGALIAALALEDGRLTLDIDDALKELTGKRYYGDADLWRRWWAANKEKFEKEIASGQVPQSVREAKDNGGHGQGDGRGGVATTSFYGIKTASKRIIFVLDISGSMREKAQMAESGPPKTPPKVTGEGASPAGQDPAEKFKPKDDTKIEIAKCELKRAIANLQEDAFFNIVFYNHDIEVYKEGMIVAKKGNKNAAYHYIDKMGPAGNTNIHDSLEKAFNLVVPGEKGKGRKKRADHVTGTGKKKAVTRGGVDTIFFLTDGKPTAGKIVEPPAILAAVRLWNATRKIQIHCVGVGDHAKDFLEKLAKQNGGTYVAR